MHTFPIKKTLHRSTQKTKAYRSIEKPICKSLYSQFLKLQALNQISKETLMIHLANERKSSTYKVKQGALNPFKNEDIYHKYNQGMQQRDMLFNKSLKEMGMLPGLPDYMIIKPNFKTTLKLNPISNPIAETIVIPHYGFIEVKTKANPKLSPAQFGFQEICRMYSIPHHVMIDYEGFEAAFEFIKGI